MKTSTGPSLVTCPKASKGVEQRLTLWGRSSVRSDLFVGVLRRRRIDRRERACRARGRQCQKDGRRLGQDPETPAATAKSALSPTTATEIGEQSFAFILSRQNHVHAQPEITGTGQTHDVDELTAGEADAKNLRQASGNMRPKTPNPRAEPPMTRVSWSSFMRTSGSIRRPRLPNTPPGPSPLCFLWTLTPTPPASLAYQWQSGRPRPSRPLTSTN